MTACPAGADTQAGSQRPPCVVIHAKIITLKCLHEPAIRKIDASSTSFWAAKNKSEAEAKGLGLLERQRVKLWLRHAYAQIDSVMI